MAMPMDQRSGVFTEAFQIRKAKLGKESQGGGGEGAGVREKRVRAVIKSAQKAWKWKKGGAQCVEKIE